VKKGLAAGDRVVVDGVDKLQPGTKVAVTEAQGRASRALGAHAPAEAPVPGSAPPASQGTTAKRP
jgi:hypothetical protein